MTDTAKKPGIKTTEFWVGVLTAPIIAIIVGALNLFNIPVTETMVATMVAPALGYVLGRGWLKSATVKKDNEL